MRRGVGYEVWLDGTPRMGVITADDKTGFITALDYSGHDGEVRLNSKRTQARLVRLHGRVEIKAVRL